MTQATNPQENMRLMNMPMHPIVLRDGKVSSLSSCIFDKFIMILGLIWQLIQEFTPPTWINHESDDDA